MSTFKSSPFHRALAAGIKANVPVAITGEPGQGKTATIENSSRSWGRHVETIIGSNRESTDFLGVMLQGEKGVEYAPFDWVLRLNGSDESVLLLDEFNTSSPTTMKAMLRVVQERYVGDTKLHDGVSIVALMNPLSSAVDAYELPAPMANRMMHLDWVFDRKNWLANVGTGFENTDLEPLENLLGSDAVARKAAVAGAITTFLNKLPQHLAPAVPTDPVEAGGAWASPRSWTNAINALAQLDAADDDAAHLVLKGCVGEGAALQYITWAQANDLYDPTEVMNNPGMVDWENDRPDRLFAVLQAVTNLGLAREEDWKKAVLVMAAAGAGGKPDAALPGATKLLNNIPEGAAIPKVVHASFAGLLSKTSYSVTA